MAVAVVAEAPTLEDIREFRLEQLLTLVDECYSDQYDTQLRLWLLNDCPWCRRLRKMKKPNLDCPVCAQMRRSELAEATDRKDRPLNRPVPAAMRRFD